MREPVLREGSSLVAISCYAAGDGKLGFQAYHLMDSASGRKGEAAVPGPSYQECARVCPAGWTLLQEGDVWKAVEAREREKDPVPSDELAFPEGANRHHDSHALKSSNMQHAKLFTGTWLHLFGPGSHETECRVVIDATRSRVVAAQARDGHFGFKDLRIAEIADLAESIFDANDAGSAPEEFGLEACDVVPDWATPILAEDQLAQIAAFESAVASGADTRDVQSKRSAYLLTQGLDDMALAKGLGTSTAQSLLAAVKAAA